MNKTKVKMVNVDTVSYDIEEEMGSLDEQGWSGMKYSDVIFLDIVVYIIENASLKLKIIIIINLKTHELYWILEIYVNQHACMINWQKNLKLWTTITSLNKFIHWNPKFRQVTP